MPTAKDFLDRLPPSATPEHRHIIQQAFDIAANFALRRQKIDADPKLSAVGKADALKALIEKDHAPQFKRLADVVVRNRAEAAAARAKLRPVPLDPAGESRRKEIRDYLRGLSPAERMRQIFEKEIIRVAAIDGENFLSGLSDAEHEAVIAHQIKEKSGAELARLDEIDEADSGRESAVTLAQREVVRSAPPTISSVKDRAADAVAARA